MAEPKQVKVIKGGLNIAKRLLDDGEGAGLTASQRAEAGRKAAELIKSQEQVKASEALGQLMEKGFKRTTTTQADRTRVGGGNIGGAPFPAISEADPAYKGKVWGVMDEGTAARLKNLTTDDTAWTTMLGSANQLKTNPIVFDKLKRGFITSMKQGNLSPELAGKINHNLALTFGEGADIRDPKIWRQADTFEKRAALADVMMGQGTAPSKGGIAIGGEKSGKGVIFKPTDILKRETEPSLLHTEHGGDVPTFAAGPRLFRLNKESVYDPSLHPGFPTLLTGEDLKINMKPTPTEVYLRDWHAKFKKDNPERKSPGYYDLALGVKGEGLPSQELNDEYIRHLLREGFKKGGKVDIQASDRRLAQAIEKRMAKGGSVDIAASDARLQAAIDARMGMAKGGEVGFKKIEFMDKGGKAGKLASGIANVGKRLLADAPQAEALKLAQERAALPVSKGGLGLPKNNTPEQRAKAMGFDRDTYHGSFRDIKRLDPSVGSTESHAGKGIYSTDSPEDASRNYASIYGPDPSGRVARGMDELEKDWRKTHGRMKDETLTPRQQDILLRNTIGTDNLGVVYPLKVRSDKSIHLDKPEKNEAMLGPFQHYDEATDTWTDTKQTPKFNEALDDFREKGGDANPIYEFVQDYGGNDEFPARQLFKVIKKEGDESGLYDPFTGDIVSGGVAAGDFMKHFGVDEIRHTPQFKSHELNIGKEHTISMNPDNVRSRFAAFDPFRKSSAIAASMGVAAPDLMAKEKDKDKKKAEGGGAFKKLEFMADGGKLVKGAAQIGKRLMADNSLPALEREANLKKFLEPSKVTERLYHGTTATEGGKRNEAIRRLKPSKEGALGSGVYMTPNTAHASGYSNIPNDEAIASMLASKYHQDTGLKALNQRNSGELLPAQEGGNMLPVHAQLRNPLIIGKSGRNIDPAADALMSLGMDEESAIRLVERAFEEKGNIGKQIQSRAQAQGYDGIMQYRGDDLSEVVSYRPNAVKSAIGNRGTYDINEPDLSKAHGGLAMADGGKLVKGLGKIGKKLLANETPKATAPAVPKTLSAGDVVNGMLVRKDIPNQSSIGASLYDYSTHGVQEVPMSAFETVGKPKYRTVQEEQYTKELARQIQENKELNPLIVVKDAQGHYILEGAHRFDALRELGIDSFPALMVHDLESLADVAVPAVKKAEGGGAFKKLEFNQHFDGGGIAIPEMNNSFEGSRREPLLTEKDWANIKRNAPEVYEWAKQNVKDEASQLKSARGVKDFALRTGAQYLGGIPDLVNLGLMGVDALADTNLSSEKPWFGSEQYIDALKRSGAVGENEFPIAETIAGVLAPAGLIKKGVKKIGGMKPAKEAPKKRRGGLTAMSR